ncbi:hypothetical protein AKJ65_07345 [candidate division MSBL1 archaeon SCGC-AAA259E19]|uniref:Flavin reductase like domain-containing protein n=1 Tax=candidate division MSBL1 archaeon SCGC-AAA259E19 TaxID=1698264 RepID=A0A133UEH9_9EURY|nr:hypothetical protein AKJ65_07345 [candidate division MSBL1 archaeon SCGC-AAA259E19]
MNFDVNNYYKLIAPRPTVCVSTVNKKGISNLAPFSFATPLSFSPPLIGVSVGKGKDTILNARETEGFVVAPLVEEWKDKGISSEVSLPREESEFEEVGLAEQDSEKVKVPSIKESPVNVECDYWDDFEVGDHCMLVGKVVRVSVKEGSLKNGRINLEELGPVGHISGEEFCVSREVVEVGRE